MVWEITTPENWEELIILQNKILHISESYRGAEGTQGQSHFFIKSIMLKADQI